MGVHHGCFVFLIRADSEERRNQCSQSAPKAILMLWYLRTNVNVLYRIWNPVTFLWVYNPALHLISATSGSL
jgi:hypothetical protein